MLEHTPLQGETAEEARVRIQALVESVKEPLAEAERLLQESGSGHMGELAAAATELAKQSSKLEGAIFDGKLILYESLQKIAKAAGNPHFLYRAGPNEEKDLRISFSDEGILLHRTGSINVAEPVDSYLPSPWLATSRVTDGRFGKPIVDRSAVFWDLCSQMFDYIKTGKYNEEIKKETEKLVPQMRELLEIIEATHK